MMRGRFPWSIGLMLGVTAGMIAWVALRPVESKLPSAPVDHRFSLGSPWQQQAIPLAVAFDMPMGSENGAFAYNAQKFWEMNERRGGHHTGDDLNGIGGMNTDLGDPVFAIADGVVLYVGQPSPGWGKMVILGHRTTDGRTLHSMYAHLERIAVPFGALVARGAVIGSVGTAAGLYPAHLHFEMRESTTVDIDRGYMNTKLNRLDPVATILQLRRAGASTPGPSVMSVALQEIRPPSDRE